MRIALAFFLFALPIAAHAETGISKCALNGYVNDPDPKGTNLRSGPSVTAPVIGHLPPQHDDADAQTKIGAEFAIIGSKDGWLQIENATDGPFNKDPTYRFKGPAWISGALVDFTIGSERLHTAPSYTSPVVAKLLYGGDGPDSFDVKRVYGCSGNFADISVQLDPGIKKNAPVLRGWVGSVCSDQVTTCDPGVEATMPQ